MMVLSGRNIIRLLLAFALIILSGSIVIAAIGTWDTFDQSSYTATGNGHMEGYSGLLKKVVTTDEIQKSMDAYLVATGIETLNTQTSSNLKWTANGVMYKEGFNFDKNWNFGQSTNIAMLHDYKLRVDPDNPNGPEMSYGLVMNFPEQSSQMTSEQANLIKDGLVTGPGNPNTLKFDPDSIDTFFGQLYDMYVNGKPINDFLKPSGMSIDTSHAMSADGVSCEWGQKMDLGFGVQVPQVQNL
jgi:hypothetical protein